MITTYADIMKAISNPGSTPAANNFAIDCSAAMPNRIMAMLGGITMSIEPDELSRPEANRTL